MLRRISSPTRWPYWSLMLLKLSMSQTATTPRERLATLHAPLQRRLVQQARETIQVEILQAVSPHGVQLARQRVDAIALVFDPHGHGGKRQQRQQREIVEAVVLQIAWPLRMPAAIVEIEEYDRIMQESDGEAQAAKNGRAGHRSPRCRESRRSVYR